jgi:hypothetical protein
VIVEVIYHVLEIQKEILGPPTQLLDNQGNLFPIMVCSGNLEKIAYFRLTHTPTYAYPSLMQNSYLVGMFLLLTVILRKSHACVIQQSIDLHIKSKTPSGSVNSGLNLRVKEYQPFQFRHRVRSKSVNNTVANWIW